MPVYFFHIRHQDGFVEDLEGQEHEDLSEVREEAIAAAREIMSENVRLGLRANETSQFEIKDEVGRVVLMMPFDEAFTDPRP